MHWIHDQGGCDAATRDKNWESFLEQLLTGEETFSFTGVTVLNDGSTPATVTVTTDTGVDFDAVVRIDTPGEADYYRNGGILQFVLRNMLRS
jgi:aconitate hydratase